VVVLTPVFSACVDGTSRMELCVFDMMSNFDFKLLKMESLTTFKQTEKSEGDDER
jgi:hypothetical protein